MSSTKALLKVKTREEAIERYEEYLYNKIDAGDEKITNEILRLYKIAQTRELKLLCFCAPKKCHGEIIRDIILKMN